MLQSNPLFWVAAAATVLVLIILVIGVTGFARGGEFNRKHGNRMMRYRLAAQALAVALIVAFAMLNGDWWK